MLFLFVFQFTGCLFAAGRLASMYGGRDSRSLKVGLEAC